MQNINLGVMLDVSRGSVLSVSAVKRMILNLESIGYKTMMLYTEDVYEIPEEPYFGYLRGRYSQKEIQEIDAFAKEHGIELIPCIQTLAHLNGIVRWNQYRQIQDIRDCLLADDERTYNLIENMFKSLSVSFSSRTVHIGMDEAHWVGLGKYLDIHGYQNRIDILMRHLTRVCEIAKKYGFTPMMWSDMFFCLASGGKGYVPVEFPESVKNTVPEGCGLVYWDYYRTTEERYLSMIQSHKQFEKTNPIWFAGGAWTWRGFTPCLQATIKRTGPALSACKKEGIDNIFTTLWGDDGGECSLFSVLPVLYYTIQARLGQEGDSNYKENFKKLTGENYDAMMALGAANEYEKEDNTHPVAKMFFYSDPFLGVLDRCAKLDMDTYFAEKAKELKSYEKDSPNFAYLFKTQSALCDVLSVKATLGMKTREAYVAQDKEALAKLANEDYVQAISKMEIFYEAYRDQWEYENKGFGWEDQDIRIGGIIKRLDYCKNKIQRYLDGKIEKIEELEEKLLPYNGRDDRIPEEQGWGQIHTPFSPLHW